jgi:catechol 2,3-dioxygenase
MDAGVASGAVRIAPAHFGLGCMDIDVMVDFYTRVLGMVVTDRGTVDLGVVIPIVFLTADPNEHHQLVLAGGRDPVVVDRSHVAGGNRGTQLFQLSFRVSDLATLRSVANSIRNEEIAPITAMNHGNAWSIYTGDPEGNAIECYLQTPWYVAQPCALDLDLSKTDDEILAETEAYCTAQPEVEPAAAWAARYAAMIAAHQSRL